MNKNPIYTVTTHRIALGAGSRCVGFYHEFQIAEDALINNDLDINEMGYYPYGIIEEVYPGFYTCPRKEYWYKWNVETNKYEKCEKPERFKQAMGWSMG